MFFVAGMFFKFRGILLVLQFTTAYSARTSAIEAASGQKNLDQNNHGYYYKYQSQYGIHKLPRLINLISRSMKINHL